MPKTVKLLANSGNEVAELEALAQVTQAQAIASQANAALSEAQRARALDQVAANAYYTLMSMSPQQQILARLTPVGKANEDLALGFTERSLNHLQTQNIVATQLGDLTVQEMGVQIAQLKRRRRGR